MANNLATRLRRRVRKVLAYSPPARVGTSSSDARGALGKPIRIVHTLGFKTKAISVALNSEKPLGEKSMIAIVRTIDGRPIRKEDVGIGWKYSQVTAGMYAYCPSVANGAPWKLPILEFKRGMREVSFEIAPWGRAGSDPRWIKSATAKFKGEIVEGSVRNVETVGSIEKADKSGA